MAKHLAPSKKKTGRRPEKRKVQLPGISELLRSTQEEKSGDRVLAKQKLPGKAELVLWGVSALLFAVLLLLPADKLGGELLRQLLFLLPLALAAFPIFRDAFFCAARLELFAEEVLVSLSLVLALVLQELSMAVLLALLYRAAFVLGLWVRDKSHRTFEELLDFQPETACLETGDGLQRVPVEELEPGSVILVSHGEAFPMDGAVLDGVASMDCSPYTGSETIRTVGPGGMVFAGCLNRSGDIRIRIAKSAEESSAAQISRIARGASDYPSRLERLSVRGARWYVPLVLLGAFLLGFVLPVFSGEWGKWLRRALILLAISGSGVLPQTVSLAFSGVVSSAFRQGILLKGHGELELLSRARCFVLDKTGIITEGRFTVSEIHPVSVSEKELLDMAAAAEYASDHPIANAIRAASDAPDPEEGSLMYLEIQPGQGVSCFVNGRQVYVGNAALLSEHGIVCSLPNRGGTAVHVAVDGSYWGYLLLTDRQREGAFDALEGLRRYGVNNLVLLTGDVLSVARPLAAALNFDMVKGELLPHGKSSAVDYLMATKADNSSLVFVGDGAEDGRVLMRADIGMTMGALGSGEAMAAADVILLDADIRKLPLTMKLALAAVNRAKLNLALWLILKLLLLLLGIFGWMPAMLALILDFVLTVFCLFNTFSTGNIR